MNWNDDEDFERELMSYSEIETLKDPVECVPTTIQRYQQRIQSNNSASIFDVDYTLLPTNEEQVRINGDNTKDLESENKGILSEEGIIRVTYGRGRGGRNVFHKPGNPDQLPDDEADVIQQLRKVAPIGYGNEITETTVRAHHKAKRQLEGSQSNSPSVTPTKLASSHSSSPVISNSDSKRVGTVLDPGNPKADVEECVEMSNPAVASKFSSPRSKISDMESLDISDSSCNSGSCIFDEDSDVESEKQQSDEVTTICDHAAVPVPNVQRPLSDMLRQCRQEYKQKQLLEKQLLEARKQQEEEANQRKIQELLREDEKERKRMARDPLSSPSSNSSSRGDVLSWRRGTRSPPRFDWSQMNPRRKNKDDYNINSTMDFPPLK